MQLDDIVEHSPLVVYLAVVVGLSIHLFPTPRSITALVLSLASVGALFLTWRYMIAFMFYSYAEWARTASETATGMQTTWRTTRWLKETSLFDQAWRYVAAAQERWWISSQLCTFTVGIWTVFLYAEASRRPALRNKAWLYMVLGQLVAISFGSGLFLSLLYSTGSSAMRSSRKAIVSTTILETSIALASASILFVPRTLGADGTGSLFLPNLLAMHAIIVLPLLPHLLPTSHAATQASAQAVPQSSKHKPLYHIYASAALFATFMHVRNTLPLLASLHTWRDPSSTWSAILEDFAKKIASAFVSHPAQQSISYDVACTNGIWQMWSWYDIWLDTGKCSSSKTWEKAVATSTIALVPTFGAAPCVGAYLAIRELWMDRKSRLNTKAA